MFKSLSRSLLWRGLFAVAVGIIAIAWPGVTIGAVVIIFAIGAFASGFAQAVQGFSSDRIGPVFGHLILALLDAAAGIVALVWPGITAYALTIWIGAWAVVAGAWEIGMVFASGEAAGRRALFAISGLLSVALGIVLFARPDIGAVSLVEVFGIFSFASGISSLVLAASTHHSSESEVRSLRSAA
jgi:uncharacterized membrane protein HdeD (DUF308 family)